MPKQQQVGFPRGRNQQMGMRYKEKHVITASGERDKRGTRTLTTGVQKRAQLLFARSMPQPG